MVLQVLLDMLFSLLSLLKNKFIILFQYFGNAIIQSIRLFRLYYITITEYLRYKTCNLQRNTKIDLYFAEFRVYNYHLQNVILHYLRTVLSLLHTTLPAYKTLHKITELLTICYITYVYHLQYISVQSQWKIGIRVVRQEPRWRIETNYHSMYFSSSKSVSLQMLFYLCVILTTLSSEKW